MAMAEKQRNYMLEVINDALDNMEFDSEREGFVVDNDSKADWVLDKIREEKAEIRRFEMAANERIQRLKESLETFKASKEQSIIFFEGKLRQYFESLNIKVTKAGNKSYKLPSGKLSLKQQSPEFTRDNDEMVRWAESYNYNDVIKIKKTVDWAKLKKDCEVVEDGMVIVKDTGELVQGVKAIERDPMFKVEV